MIRANAMIPVLAAIVFVSCSQEDPAAPGTGVQTSAHLSVNSVAAGQSFELTVRAYNYGPKTAQIAFTSGCTFGYRFVSAAGDVFTVPLFCPGIGSKLSLNAGQYYEQTFMVPTLKPAQANWPIAGDRLPAGDYTLEAGMLDNEPAYPWAEVPIKVTQ